MQQGERLIQVMNERWWLTLLNSLVMAQLVAIAQGVQAIPVGIPAGLIQQSTPTAPSGFDLSAQPIKPSVPVKLELPQSAPIDIQPIYIEESPLRLEIKLSRRRVTLYRGNTALKTYPIAVGRPGWETPTGKFSVRQMFRNPTWVHPLKPGIEIPGGDPENPLGRFWIGFWTDGKNWIGFHGTPNPGSVGTAASHGCIRMYNKDIEELFKKISLGTEVKVIK